MKPFVLSLMLILTLFSCKNEEEKKLDEGIYAEIQTNKGKIVTKLEYEKVPVTVANFISLAEGKNPFVEAQYKGKPFYDGLTFHRVMPNFMIQGGDPLANGLGNPGYKFNDEFDETLRHSKPGILSMANSGPNTNGSQFFITHTQTPWLDNVHSVFGEVVEGQNVVDSVAQNDVIEKITINRIGPKAKKFDAVKIFKEYYEKAAEEQKIMAQKFEATKAEMVAKIEQLKVNGTKTKSGLIYTYENKGQGEKPKVGSTIFINYAGYFENGELFDTSYQNIAEKYNMLNPQRAAANAYKPFDFKYGDKQGLIPGFIEAFDTMKIGDKILIFIPSKLGYGTQPMGMIPPNTDLIFEIEMLDSMPN